LDKELGLSLKQRLETLDSSGGYRPNQDGTQSALSWVVAGSVLAKTPPELGRHHFLDPKTGAGLDDAPHLSGTLHALALSIDEGTTSRDLATGQAFDLRGKPALEWLRSSENDLGLPVFYEQLERSVTFSQPADRETALVRALLALGGVLCVVEDMGQPAFTRNDFRGEFLGNGMGSAFEGFVRRKFGRAALPRPLKPIVRPTLQSYFIAKDGKGLAQISNEGFFSAGTLPNEVPVWNGRPLTSIIAAIHGSLRFASPTIAELNLSVGQRGAYLLREGRRMLGYRQVERTLQFFLDEAIYLDSAQFLLPLVEAYAAGIINHLLRGSLEITADAGKIQIKPAGIDAAKGLKGRLVVLAEAEDGKRSMISETNQESIRITEATIPVGARKIAAVWVGEDQAGQLIALGEMTLPR
jgi:hypothetical protein